MSGDAVPAVATERRRIGSWIALVLVFAAALGVRLVRFSDPPLDFHPTRQYRSALLARHLYLDGRADAAAWRRDLARINAPGAYEPPLLEHLVALAYRLFGREDLRLARALSIVAWLVGGGLLYALARRLAGDHGALVAAAFFLLSPFGVEASRSFQPDPLMVTLLVASAWALLCYAERPQAARLLTATVCAGLAVLVKPMAVFQVLGGFAAISLMRPAESRGRRLLHAAIFLTGLALPVAPHYLAQLAHGGATGAIAQQSFIPQLLVTPGFWIGWIGQVWKTCGLVAPAAAAIGIVLVRDRAARRLLAGLAAGYVVFVLVFNYQGSTHDYYHLQLVPLVALGLAALAQRVLEALQRGTGAPRVAVALAGAIFAAGCLDAAVSARSRLRAHHFEAELAAYSAVGAIVAHAPSNVLLADAYAYPLQYHAELGGSGWPRWYDFNLMRLMGTPEPSAASRLEALVRAQQPHFFVVTVPAELASQTDLAALLERTYARVAGGDGYVIYDLTQALTPASTQR